MAKALQARLERLEAASGYGIDLPRTLIISRCDAEDERIIGMTSDDISLVRLPGESIEQLEARAEAYPLHMPGAVRCWFRRYSDEQGET